MRQREAKPGSQGLQELLQVNDVIPGWDENKDKEPEVVAAGQQGRNKSAQEDSPGISLQLPAGCCCHSPGSVSEPETGLPRSRVTDPNGSISLRSCGGRLAVVERSPLDPPI